MIKKQKLRNTNQFKKKKNKSKNNQTMNSETKNNNTIFLNFLSTPIVDKKLINGQLWFKRVFPNGELVQCIITKTEGGYQYEDLGVFVRNFPNAESIIWEFELPKSIKIDIEGLKILAKPFKKVGFSPIGKTMMEDVIKTMTNDF
jgi:hypothetical protein